MEIRSAFDLYTHLSHEFGDRANLDGLAALTGSVQGKIDDVLVSITYMHKEYALVTLIGNGNDELFDELVPQFNSIMGARPIIKYDMNHSKKGQDIVKPTMEWDVVDPENRIKEIINGRAFPDKPEISGIVLYNGKDVDSYLETKEEQEERIKNARIYGIDTGSISDIEAINNLDEVGLFFQIHALGYHIWRCNHDMSHGRIPVIDLSEEQYALEYLVYQTTKFGVTIPEPEIDKHVVRTPEYDAWYKFYNEHFNNVLTEKEWKEYLTLREAGEDVSHYMPKGNWRDLLPVELKKGLK